MSGLTTNEKKYQMRKKMEKERKHHKSQLKYFFTHNNPKHQTTNTMNEVRVINKYHAIDTNNRQRQHIYKP